MGIKLSVFIIKYIIINIFKIKKTVLEKFKIKTQYDVEKKRIFKNVKNILMLLNSKQLFKIKKKKKFNFDFKHI